MADIFIDISFLILEILTLSLGLPIGGEVEIVPQTQQSFSRAWLLIFHGSSIVVLRPISGQCLTAGSGKLSRIGVLLVPLQTTTL